MNIYIRTLSEAVRVGHQMLGGGGRVKVRLEGEEVDREITSVEIVFVPLIDPDKGFYGEGEHFVRLVLK